jgi:hypothetical protein
MRNLFSSHSPAGPARVTPARRFARRAASSFLFAAALAVVSTPFAQAQEPGYPSILGNLDFSATVSTVPANGDVNPYGVSFVPEGFEGTGMLREGDLLISNFNNSQNLQGTGTTIVRIRDGQPSLFFQGQSSPGLSTGLQVLRAGLVIVASFPTSDGTSATAAAGSILAIDASGKVVWTYANSQIVDGPWDLTVNDMGSNAQIFVSNVLNGTISRIDISMTSEHVNLTDALVIATGFNHRGDPAALEVGPTGLAYDAFRDTLYVAASFENSIIGVANAGKMTEPGPMGYVVYQDQTHLHGPLGMTLAPNGDLIVANSDVINGDPTQPSELVEFTPGGKFVTELSVDPNQGGSFGLNIGFFRKRLYFAAVDDNANNVTIWTVDGFRRGRRD